MQLLLLLRIVCTDGVIGLPWTNILLENSKSNDIIIFYFSRTNTGN